MSGAPDGVRRRLDDVSAGPLHVLLDPACLAGVVERLQCPGAPPSRGLGARGGLAPHLASVPAEGAFREWLLDEAWGRSAIVFLQSRVGLAPLARHVRSLMRAWGPDLQPVHFRLHDPRVLRLFLPLCEPAQGAAFFGPVTAWLCEEDPPLTASRWTRVGDRIVRESLAEDDPA